MNTDLLIYCAAIFASALVGGLVTLVRHWSDYWLHLFLSFGAGVFLATVFTHLLPQAMEQGDAESVGSFVLIGYLLIFFVEKFLFYRRSENGDHVHPVVSITALIGLSVHSVIAGMGLAVFMSSPEVAAALLISILAHKTPAAFSLASLMILAKHSRRRIVISMLVFASMTPLGALVLAPALDAGNEKLLLILTSVVTGTFLYVATADLLPEVFHSRQNRWLNLLLLLLGILVMGTIGLEHHH
ncbi:MAG: ZIP family metal transporter [bacterium]|nr:ZIP family metal transporter [bacterium]